MQSTASRVLVTGGRGFIGRRVLQRLDSPLVWDIGEVPCLGHVDGLIHLAAVSRVKDGEGNPRACVQTNVLFTADVLELVRRQVAWVVLVGTQEKGENYYGMSKRFAEAYARRYCAQHGIKLMVIRPPVVYGDGDNQDKLLPRLKAGTASDVDPGAEIRIAHVDEVVNAIIDHMGLEGEYDILGDKVRLGSLQKLIRYVANPDS